MGASGWDYVTAYRGDLASSLAALHAEQFSQDGSYFRGVLGRWDLPQPATLDELWSEPYGEFMGNNGTHSILDIPTMEDITPLSADEVAETFGTEQPTRADWDRVSGEFARGVRHLLGDRWTGRGVILHRDGKPDEVAFWGFSGD